MYAACMAQNNILFQKIHTGPLSDSLKKRKGNLWSVLTQSKKKKSVHNISAKTEVTHCHHVRPIQITADQQSWYRYRKSVKAKTSST